MGQLKNRRVVKSVCNTLFDGKCRFAEKERLLFRQKGAIIKKKTFEKLWNIHKRNERSVKGMGKAAVRTVEIKEDITSRNNAQAEEIRKTLQNRGIFYLNVMSSPGSGKTTLLLELIRRLKGDYRIGVIEADIDSAVDGEAIRLAGVRVIQMHTAGACHITCQMSREALEALGIENLDLVILENIGNLVCPAEFDTGAARSLVLLSVPEGDDKPLKYPLMFQVASAVAVTKRDVAPAFDFSLDRVRENIRRRNPDAPVFFVSAVTREGMDELEDYLREEIGKERNLFVKNQT